MHQIFKMIYRIRKNIGGSNTYLANGGEYAIGEILSWRNHKLATRISKHVYTVLLKGNVANARNFGYFLAIYTSAR